jgi:hypothetical protein
MALIRGARGLCPCPICLVPLDRQSDLSANYPLRTANSTMAIVHDARQMPAVAGENHLKRYGLRNIDVGFLFVSTTI